MSWYAASRSAGAKPLADTPATIVAIPPPNQRVKPKTCTKSQKPRNAASSVLEHVKVAFPACLGTRYHFGNRLPPRVSRLHFMPELDAFLALLPAPEYLLPVQLAVEVHESRLESLEHAADLVELEQEIVDLARDIVDAAAQGELFGRLAPLGPRLRGHELVLRHQIAPLEMKGDQVGDDTLHQWKSPIAVVEGEVLSIPCQ